MGSHPSPGSGVPRQPPGAQHRASLNAETLPWGRCPGRYRLAQSPQSYSCWGAPGSSPSLRTIVQWALWLGWNLQLPHRFPGPPPLWPHQPHPPPRAVQGPWGCCGISGGCCRCQAVLGWLDTRRRSPRGGARAGAREATPLERGRRRAQSKRETAGRSLLSTARPTILATHLQE